MVKNKIVQYGIYTLKQTAEEKNGGKIITKDSKVIVMDFLDNDYVLVCRYGYYQDTLRIRIDLLV